MPSWRQRPLNGRCALAAAPNGAAPRRDRPEAAGAADAPARKRTARTMATRWPELLGLCCLQRPSRRMEVHAARLAIRVDAHFDGSRWVRAASARRQIRTDKGRLHLPRSARAECRCLRGAGPPTARLGGHPRESRVGHAPQASRQGLMAAGSALVCVLLSAEVVRVQRPLWCDGMGWRGANHCHAHEQQERDQRRSSVLTWPSVLGKDRPGFLCEGGHHPSSSGGLWASGPYHRRPSQQADV